MSSWLAVVWWCAWVASLVAVTDAAYDADQARAMCRLTCTTNVASVLDWSCSSCSSPATSVCDWSRVKCDGEGTVTSIDLKPSLVTVSSVDQPLAYEHTITGSIPPQLRILSELKELDLSFNSLQGTIPTQLGGLSALVTLELSGNDFTGPIPVELGQLSALQRLALRGNAITGTIPIQLLQLSRLTHLIIGDNEMTGELPVGFNSFPSLLYLDVSANKFDGELTFMDSASLLFANASNNKFTDFPAAMAGSYPLEVLIVDNNLLRSLPASLGDSVSYVITTIVIADNNLTNAGLPDLSNLETLIYIDARNCGLSGVPDFIEKVQRLQYIDLSENSLSGSLPAGIDAMTDLEYLDLSQTRMTGQIPSSMGALSKLEFIYLADNSLVGTVPASLCDLSDLHTLDISGNPDIGCYYQCLSATDLIIDDTNFHCPGEQDIALCDLADSLGVEGTVSQQVFVTDAITLESDHPRTHGTVSGEQYSLTLADSSFRQFQITFDDLTDLTNEVVRICNLPSCAVVYKEYGGHLNTKFPGTGEDDALTVMSSTLYIEVAELNISTLSEWGFSLEVKTNYRGSGWNCTTLSNGDRYAEGLCEDEWTGVTCLYGTRVHELDLSALDLAGTLPSSIGNLIHLSALDLSFNDMTGTIPSQIFLLTRLETIDLSVNGFSGSLPEISNATALKLENLYSLKLNANSLSGTLPTFPLYIPYLQELGLQHNDFSGSMDEAYCDIDFDYTLVSISTNNELCYADCWTEIVASDVSTCGGDSSNGSSLSDALIITISVCSFVICVLFVMFALFYKRNSKVGSVEVLERLRRLETLPVHRAILSGASESEVHSVIQKNKESAKERDYDGHTAIDIILRSQSAMRNVSAASLFELIDDSLPMDVNTGAPISDPEKHVYAWPSLVGTSEEKWVAVVSMVLHRYKKYVEQLANACDAQGRRSIDVAAPVCKDMITRMRFLYERYELRPGPPLHISDSSCLVLAVDHDYDHAASDLKVALKFMRHKDAFDREVETRKRCDFDKEYVVLTYRSFDGEVVDSDDNKKFRDDAILKGFAEYPYCIVMEAGDSTLQSLIFHQNMSGNDWDEIRRITKHLVLAVQHIHSKGVIHGDLKPMNLILINGHPQLVDFDASVSVENKSFAGAKVSTVYAAPELLYARRGQGDREVIFVKSTDKKVTGSSVNPNNGSQGIDKEGGIFDLEPANYTLDMWSIGAILYLLCTGCTLFLATVDDNIYDPDDLKHLYDWSPSTKAKKLSSISNAVARNLISMLLTKDPTRRPDCAHVLSHAFFTGRVPARFVDGEKPKYDVFISYRVQSDRLLAALLYQELVERELNVWMDSFSLASGMNWEEGFCSGLINSAYMVCVMSREAINSSTEPQRNLTTRKSSSPCDNVVLEWRLALELQERGLLLGIFPVLVGDAAEGSEEYGDYFRSGCAPKFDTEIVVDSIEDKLQTHLEREGLGLPYRDRVSVKAVVQSILSNQGGFLRGDFKTALSSIVDKIDAMQRSSCKHGDAHHVSGGGAALAFSRSSPRDANYSSDLSVAECIQLLQRKDAEISVLHEKQKELETYTRNIQEDIRQKKEELNNLVIYGKEPSNR